MAGSGWPSGDGGTIVVVVINSISNVVDAGLLGGGRSSLPGVGVGGNGAPPVVIVGDNCVINCSLSVLLCPT